MQVLNNTIVDNGRKYTLLIDNLSVPHIGEDSLEGRTCIVHFINSSGNNRLFRGSERACGAPTPLGLFHTDIALTRPNSGAFTSL